MKNCLKQQLNIIIIFLLLFFPLLGQAAETKTSGNKSFDPDLHRISLRKNVDRTATLEKVSRNPRRFQGIFAGFEGRILEIKEEGASGSKTYLLCTNERQQFIASLAGNSDRFSPGIWVEAYGTVRSRKNPFLEKKLPMIQAVRVFTPEDVVTDSMKAKELNLYYAALKNGGFHAFGSSLLRRNEFSDAAFVFRTALRFDPATPSAEYHYLHAVALFNMKKLAEAAIAVKNSFVTAPQDARSNFLFARILFTNGDFTNAKLYLERSLRQRAHPRPCYWLGKVWLKLGKPMKALEQFKMGLELLATQDLEEVVDFIPEWKEILLPDATLFTPVDDAKRTYGMRKNSFSEREWKMRREWLDKEVSSLKELTETLHLEIARLHLTRGYGEKAEEHLLTLKESKNKEVTNLLRRAEHMTKKVVMGHKQSVEVRLNKLVDQCVVELGLEYTPFEYQKQPANLEAELLWAITQRPVESKFYNFLALLKLYEQNWSEALAWSHEARRRETDNSRQEITHGFALYFNNRLTEAQQIFAAVPHIDSRVRRAGDYANMVVEITDQLQKAGISNSSSRRARIHLDMGNRHSTQKDWGNALFHYQEGLRFAPFHKDLTFNLGFVLLRLNRKKEANAIFKELFKDKTEGHRFAEHLHKLGYTWVELQVLGYSLRSSW